MIANFYNYSPKKIGNEIDMQVSLAKFLNEQGEVLLWIFRSCKYDDLFLSSRRPGLEVEIIPTGLGNGLRLILHLLKIIRERDVRVMHLQFINPFLACTLIIATRLCLRKTRFIYHKRSPGRMIGNSWNVKKHINPLRILSWGVDRIVVNSESIRENCLNRGVSAKKIVRIYNGTEIEKFEKARDHGAIRKEFHIPPEFKIISVIKDARPEVGLKDLLVSIPDVIRGFPNVVFLIVGGGVEIPSLQKLSQELGIGRSVIFAGIRDDVPEIIAESYFTVDPSPVEAFGFVIIESMAGRRPVVAVDAWGPKEIIMHGETGLLVKPGSPTNFAPAILELLKSPEKVKCMGDKGYERVVKYFQMERMSKETAELSMDCLKKQ